jgi:hypothetical protein
MNDTGGGGTLDSSKIALVAKLLDKASSTQYEAEALALVERSYSLLAELITRYDHENQGGASRRRERRLLSDRRRGTRSPLFGFVRVGGAKEAAERYRQVADSTDPRTAVPRGGK